MTDLHWTAGLHHDGSAVYVSNPRPMLRESVIIRLRAPVKAPVRQVLLRSVPDGEQHFEAMSITDTDAACTYWTATLPATMPVNTYRFKILSDEGSYILNQLGISRVDGPDFYDFKLLADYAAPDWVQGSIFYQIFPDRFHNGEPALTVQPGAWTKREHSVIVRDWDERPQSWSVSGNLDFYGGDLPGIVQKLDYLQDLGINALYLNPIFVSHSNHRYNVEDFFNIDPHLGGNQALIDLRAALNQRGMRLMLDITPNHIGSLHPWFTAAQADLSGPTAEYFTFYNENPDHYLAWLGVRSLVKLNYRSQNLRDHMYRAADSVLRHWLKAPYAIDGWRLDVLNMTARQGADQLAAEVGRELRQAVKADNPALYLIGESFFDGTPHLQGDQMDAVMNYQGFTIPLWRWLSGYDSAAWQFGETMADLMTTASFAEQLNRFRAAIPWTIAAQQFNHLGTHDTWRIRSIVQGDDALNRLAVALLLSYPGVPSIYYGDEVGLEGQGDPDNRRTMPWDESAWDTDLRAHYQRLIKLRRENHALRYGGFQTLYADDGLYVFQRESVEQRLIMVMYRGPGERERFELPLWHAGLSDSMVLRDLLNSSSYHLENGRLTLGSLKPGATLILEGG